MTLQADPWHAATKHLEGFGRRQTQLLVVLGGRHALLLQARQEAAIQCGLNGGRRH